MSDFNNIGNINNYMSQYNGNGNFPMQRGTLNPQHYDPYRNYNNNPVQQFNQNDMLNRHSIETTSSSQFNSQLSVQQEPSIEYEKREHYLVVTSLNRNTTQYPNQNHYQITLDKEYKNVYQIELIQSILPDKNNITQEPYILLKVDEITETMDSVDTAISQSFAILCLPSPTGNFLVIDKRIHENVVRTFIQPKAKLDKITITVSDHLGQPFNFGSGTEKQLQNTFVFKLTTLEKKRDSLNHRNVF